MGVMKVIATKEADGVKLSPQERALIKAGEELAVQRSLTPLATVRQQEDKSMVLYLSWPDQVFKQFKKLKEMYFFSWSHNWLDEQVFHPVVHFLPQDQMYKYFHGDGKGDVVKVAIDGPYEPEAFTDDYQPFSPYETTEQGQAVYRLCQESCESLGKTYLWHAKLE